MPPKFRPPFKRKKPDSTATSEVVADSQPLLTVPQFLDEWNESKVTEEAVHSSTGKDMEDFNEELTLHLDRRSKKRKRQTGNNAYVSKLLGQANSLFMDNKLDEAVKVLQLCCINQPICPTAFGTWALILKDQKKFKDALVVEHIAADQENSLERWQSVRGLAIQVADRKMQELALNKIIKLLGKGEEDKEEQLSCMRERAELLCESDVAEDRKLGIKIYKRLFNQDYQYRVTGEALARFYYHNDQVKNAISILEKVKEKADIKKDGTPTQDFNLTNQLAEAYYYYSESASAEKSRKKYQEKIVDLLTRLKADTAPAEFPTELEVKLISCRMLLGHVEDAEKLDQVCALDEERRALFQDCLWDAGSVCLQCRCYAKAIQCLGTLRDAEYLESPSYYATFAHASLGAGDLDAARKHIARAKELVEGMNDSETPRSVIENVATVAALVEKGSLQEEKEPSAGSGRAKRGASGEKVFSSEQIQKLKDVLEMAVPAQIESSETGAAADQENPTQRYMAAALQTLTSVLEQLGGGKEGRKAAPAEAGGGGGGTQGRRTKGQGGDSVSEVNSSEALKRHVEAEHEDLLYRTIERYCGVLNRLDGNPEKAVTFARQVMKEHFRTPGVRLSRGKLCAHVLFKGGELAEAHSALRAHAGEHFSDYRLWQLFNDIHLQTAVTEDFSTYKFLKRCKDKVEKMEQADRPAPAAQPGPDGAGSASGWPVKLLLANHFLTHSSVDQAISLYHAVSKVRPGEPLLYLLLGVALLQKACKNHEGKPNAIIQQSFAFLLEYKRLRGGDESQEAWYNVGRACMHLQWNESAIQCFDKAVALSGSVPSPELDLRNEALYNLAYVYRLVGSREMEMHSLQQIRIE